jgi:hypothetical protein
MQTHFPYETLVGKSPATIIRELEQLIGAAQITLAEGGRWLVNQRAPLGPIMGERDVSYVYKSIWGAYAAGVERRYIAKMLDWLHAQALQPNGDFFFPAEPADHRVDTRAYRQFVFLKFAALLDHPIVHDERVMRRMAQYQDPATGGCFYYIGEDPDRPAYPDFCSVGDTAFFGEFALAAGWRDAALRAGRWMLKVVADNAKHMAQTGDFYTLADRRGDLITQVSPGEKINKTVNNRDANQMGWNLGCALAFLADLYAALRHDQTRSDPTGRTYQEYIKAILTICQFEDTMPLETYFYPSKCKVVWGTGRVLDIFLRYGLAIEEDLDRLYRISKRVFVHTFLGSQLPDGSWPGIHYPLHDDAPELQFDYRVLKGLTLYPQTPIRGSATCSYLPAVEVTGEILGEIGALLEGLSPLIDYYRRM